MEHLGLIVGSQKQADAILKHFGSLTVLARASVDELLPFVSRSKALRLVSSLRMGAVALREERQSLTIDSPLSIADLCCEMRFLDREILRAVLLNAKQHLIKVRTVSQGSVNESLGHPREIFKPVITHSAYSFILVHNHPSGDPSPSEADLRLTRRINEASRILQINLLDHVIIGAQHRAGAAILVLRKAALSDNAAPCQSDLPAIRRASLIKQHRESSPPQGEPPRKRKSGISISRASDRG